MALIVRVPLILSVAMGIHISLTSPTPTTPKNRRVMGDYPGALFMSILILKYACWAHAAIEVVIIVISALAHQAGPGSAFARWSQESFMAFLLPNGNIFLSRGRMFSGLSVVLGSVIRYLCYRELGRHFTYHVTVLKKHRLVTTGLYAIVRHPAYTGGNLVQVGLVFWHTASGAWLRESGVYKVKVAWLVLLPSLASVVSILVMYARRPLVEDKVLKKEFGKEWEEWTERVPYRLFPGIY
ncbi:hypothetical protein BDZ97DRAFT_1921140 [Flammula alnicola]|nr:hypothetical protein BDZ97DRAFT_1921140 [Flammula alnicola]